MAHMKYAVANWKQNPNTYREAKKIFSGVARRLARAKKGLEIVVCPPIPFLKSLSDGYKSRRILFGTQDVSSFGGGAHTGEVSVAQIKESGARYVILGHSERRAKGETSDVVARKVEAAVLGGIHPIVCVGESTRDQNGEFLSFVTQQIKESLATVGKEIAEHVVIAYEPVWAIGGDATHAMDPHDVHQMTLFIRKVLVELWGQDGVRTPILYGGSVKASNAETLVREGAVDGFLVGGASLNAEEFSKIALSLIQNGGK